MNRLRHLGVGTALLAITAMALAASVEDTFTLKRTPKEGESAKYRITAKLDLQGQELTFTALTSEKTLKVDADGTYSVESAQIEAKVHAGDQDVDIPSQGSTVTAYKANGEIQEIRGNDSSANSYRMANLNTFFPPEAAVKVGDTWTKTLKADSATGAVDVSITFRLVAAEKVGDTDALKVEAKAAEAGTGGAASNYTAWLKKDTYDMLKVEGEWKNAPLSGAPSPMDATYTFVREP